AAVRRRPAAAGPGAGPHDGRELPPRPAAVARRLPYLRRAPPVGLAACRGGGAGGAGGPAVHPQEARRNLRRRGLTPAMPVPAHAAHRTPGIPAGPCQGRLFLYRAPPGHPPDFTAGARDCGNVQVFTLYYRRLEWHRSVRGTTKKSYPRKLLSSAWASWGFPWQDTWRGRATR